MDLSIIIACVLISLLAAAIHGVVGFGFNFIGAPVLLLIYPRLVPAPIVLVSVVMVCLVGWKSRQHIVVRHLGWAIAASALGAVLAGVAIAAVSLRTYQALFGTMLLVAVAVSLGGWRPRLTAGNASVAGLISGFIGTITSIGGPPVALLYQGLTADQVRGTLSAFFLLTTPFVLFALLGAGRLTLIEVELSVVLLPGMLMGYACSRLLVKRLDQGMTRIGILVISAVGAFVLLGRYFATG